MGDSSTKELERIIVEDDEQTEEPPMYRVVLLNDDYTTMEFVVMILETVFNKTTEEATQVMLSVHNSGAGTAGVFTKEIAETKVEIVHQIARQNEYPLKCIMEPA
ncbi:MAG: ATP-dependent Clp protease adapter ClpS [Bdellovibrionales bacterium]|nr:ATP-dependent Clp protease adapter ClpS [Bdellovibrionales bacterium]